MKDLTIKIPDGLERNRVKYIIAQFLFKQNLVSIEEAACIAEIEEQAFWDQFREKDVLNSLSSGRFSEPTPDYRVSIKPLRSALSLEQMKVEQGYEPIQKDLFFEKADQLNIEEPLEQLLEMLD